MTFNCQCAACVEVGQSLQRQESNVKIQTMATLILKVKAVRSTHNEHSIPTHVRKLLISPPTSTLGSSVVDVEVAHGTNQV